MLPSLLALMLRKESMKPITVNAVGIPELSLRQLKAMLHVAKYQNLTRAAQHLNRSQTAITKAISDLETHLGVILFDRSSTGMLPTIYATVLAARMEQVEAEFLAAGQAYLEFIKSTKSVKNISVFSMDISYKRLASFIALYDSKDISAAAKRLGITRAAIYNSIRQLEDILDIKLFERELNGVVSTSFSEILARHFKLAFAEVRHAIEDIASINGVTRGRVVIGTLPYTRSVLTPRAINRLLEAHPQLDISTVDGPYALLEASLRSGDLDFIVGATRAIDQGKNLATEDLFGDRLAFIVRTGHPLQGQTNLTLSDLNDYGWVLPNKRTPARQLFQEVLDKNNVSQPEHSVETSSLSTIRGLLIESDRIALLSEHQIYYEKKYGILSSLPIELADTHRPIGVTMRAKTRLSPAAQLFLHALRKIAEELAEDQAIYS